MMKSPKLAVALFYVPGHSSLLALRVTQREKVITKNSEFFVTMIMAFMVLVMDSVTNRSVF